ncbi:hypothetical protein ACIPLC_33265 [Kitasatospora sp. NPDC086801]|uniref:hypothetical protein n=1 Tax=Kitasatospora sp. NPDC086801 TaxID=3364066 RepID=UPI003802D237
MAVAGPQGGDAGPVAVDVGNAAGSEVVGELPVPAGAEERVVGVGVTVGNVGVGEGDGSDAVQVNGEVLDGEVLGVAGGGFEGEVGVVGPAVGAGGDAAQVPGEGMRELVEFDGGVAGGLVDVAAAAAVEGDGAVAAMWLCRNLTEGPFPASATRSGVTAILSISLAPARLRHFAVLPVRRMQKNSKTSIPEPPMLVRVVLLGGGRRTPGTQWTRRGIA